MADDSGMEHTESDIWASPTQDTPHEPRPKTPRTPKTPKTPTGTETRPEPIDHEAALRKELEGVRGINEGIEGVISTLERAGGNMEVCAADRTQMSLFILTATSPDRLENRQQRFDPAEHMDPNSVPDRAQPTTSSPPRLERRDRRSGRTRGGSLAEGAGQPAEGGRGRTKTRGGPAAARRRG